MKTKIWLVPLRIMLNRVFLSLLILVLGHSIGMAQVWDFSTWHRVKVGGDLNKKLSLSVEQQLRLFDNSRKIDDSFTELGLNYDLPKGFEVGGAYRLTWFDSKNGFSNSHRYNIDIAYGKKFWKLKADVRARFQHRPSTTLLNERLQPDDSPMLVRLKFSVAYNKLKKWKPGLEFETFIRVDSPTENGAHRFRYRAFLDYDLPKRQTLGLFYMLQTDYSSNTPEFTSVVGVNFSYEWKLPKKKKKKDKKSE